MMSGDEQAIDTFRTYLRIRTEQPSPDYHSCRVFLEKVNHGIPLILLYLSSWVQSWGWMCGRWRFALCRNRNRLRWQLVPGKPVVLMTLCGSDPRLPSILLNSHTDVVPVTAVGPQAPAPDRVQEKWTHAPFAAEMTPDGRIYARGSQDMKCVGIGYFEAIRRLRASGRTLRRTVHLSFVPGTRPPGRA